MTHTTSTTEHGKAESVTLSLELRSGLEAREVERRALAGYRAGDLGARVTAFYLADLADRNMYQALGFASLRQFARQRMRMAPSTLHEYVMVGRQLNDLPELDRMFAEDELCWSQVRQLVKIVTPETQIAWGEWARERTVRELRQQISRREKGQLPTDPARRRIHTTTVTVRARLNPLQQAVLEVARAAIEAKAGGHISDSDLIMWIAHEVVRGSEAEPLTLRPPRADLDPLNQDPALPHELRDPKTGSSLQKKILERDGHQCVCCGSHRNLSAHHKQWRRYGGRTDSENLVTLCENCHSLVHDRFLILRGTVGDLAFLDSEGRELGERLPPQAFKFQGTYEDGDSARAESSAARGVSFKDVPREVDAEWWRRHRHLFAWNQRVGGLEFLSGSALAAPSEEAEEEVSQQPSVVRGLDELIGQERVRESLRIAIQAARERDESLGHVLLAGPPGLGKTSLARAIASELGGELHTVMAPVIRDPALLVRHLTSLQPKSVLFLDEIHRLPARAAEGLYDALEDGVLNLPVRCNWDQRALRIRLAPFTLVAATTQEQGLPAPLLSRFVHRQHLEFYGLQELGRILSEVAVRSGLELTPEARDRVAGASRDTPRDGLALLQAVCDEAKAARKTTIDADVVNAALVRTGTTPCGVTAAERTYLRVLASAGRPMGVGTLAAKLGTTKQTVRRIYEPYLLRRDMIRLTTRGRCIGEQPSGLVTAA